VKLKASGGMLPGQHWYIHRRIVNVPTKKEVPTSEGLGRVNWENFPTHKVWGGIDRLSEDNNNILKSR